MYPKGANMLQTIRALLKNDKKWRNILRGLNKELGLKTTSTQEVEAYLSKHTGMNLKPVFDQYLRTVDIPELNYEIRNGKLFYRWANVVEGFNMPVLVNDGQKDIWLKPAKSEKSIPFKGDSLTIAPAFYVNLKQVKTNL